MNNFLNDLQGFNEIHHNVPIEALKMYRHPHMRSNHWNTWYNARADYQTNALSYYDYLAEMNLIPLLFESIINYLLSRDILFKETDSILPKKEGDWAIGDSILTISNTLKLSKHIGEFVYKNYKYDLPNELEIFKDGAYSPDYQKLFEYILDKGDEAGNNIDKIFNTDVGNHLSLSSDKNTLELTRKKLDGTVLNSDKAPVGIGDILNRLTKIENTIGGGVGEITTTETVWTGTRNEGQSVPVNLATGEYDITVHSNDIGAYTLRIIYSKDSPINHNSITTPYVPASSDGSFWIMQPKLTNDTNPIFRVTMIKYDHSSQTSSVSNSGNNCQIVGIKKVVRKKLG